MEDLTEELFGPVPSGHQEIDMDDLTEELFGPVPSGYQEIDMEGLEEQEESDDMEGLEEQEESDDMEGLEEQESDEMEGLEEAIPASSAFTGHIHALGGAQGAPAQDNLGTDRPMTVSSGAEPDNASEPGSSGATVAPALVVEPATTVDVRARPTATPLRVIARQLQPRPDTPSPGKGPIAFSMADSPAAPKLDSRFIIDNKPTKPQCKILALDPNYRAPRRVNSHVARTKEMYVEEFEDNDGFRQKALWVDRGRPQLDEYAVIQLERLMNEAAQEAKNDHASREAGIKEQTAIDLAAKKVRDREKIKAMQAAQVRAHEKRQQEMKGKKKAPSVFIQPKKRRP
ncbi:hypothetical protein F4777DRAFT_581144 [Nemania sp. FL0916]|nr:hypothetical protein F4777DRAFT_581144 [Nemania sp. FL0916]